MKIRVYVTILTVLLIWGCKDIKPVFEINPREVKTDTIIAGEQRAYHFKIFNRGSKDLIIEDYVAGCECTQINLFRNQKVSSNDSIPLNIIISTKKEEANKLKEVECTFKTNATPTFYNIALKFYIKQGN
ncbi:MAG: DUF1573 domain-containing protein [Sphingobacteriales bacterium]|nr:DUF1573 domain-containing protein [Sphingobacteriales bacterium]